MQGVYKRNIFKNLYKKTKDIDTHDTQFGREIFKIYHYGFF